MRRRRDLLARFTLAALLAIAGAVSHAAPFAYVANRSAMSVSKIDVATRAVVATIPVADRPLGIAVNAAGTRVYVSNELANTVSIIDATTHTVVETVRVSFNPTQVALNPSLPRLYVSTYTPNQVQVIDTLTLAVIATIPVALRVGGLLVNSAGTRLYITDFDANRLLAVDTANHAVLHNMTLGVPTTIGPGPTGLAIDPAGTSLYIGTTNPNPDGHVKYFDLTINNVMANVPVGGGAADVAINPAATRVYSANFASNTVSVIDTASNLVVATVPVGIGPEGIGVTPSGTEVYVTNASSNDITVIDSASNTVATTLPAGLTPTKVVFGPAPPNPPRLANISTRGQVLGGNDVMIAGFIVDGDAAKTVVVRASGPSLASQGIANALQNPVLTLMRSSDGAVVASNNDWQSAPNAARIQAHGLAPADPAESAIMTTLAPGAYTAVVQGAGGGTGIGLVAVFEVGGPDLPLINLSTRAQVGAGGDVLIAGFIIQGAGPQDVVVNVAGPSLVSAGILSPLANPRLTLVRSSDNAVIAANDNWQDAANAAAIQASGFAPSHSLEPAIRISLPPGAYTAIVEGAGTGGTGVGVVGVFKAS